MDKLVTFIE